MRSPRALAVTYKNRHFLGGTHSFNVGYTWQFPTYDDHHFSPVRSTEIPAQCHGRTLAMGQTWLADDGLCLLSLAAGNFAPGTWISFSIPINNPNDTTCTLCPFMVIPVTLRGPGRATETRGASTAASPRVAAKYHAAYVNDAWQIASTLRSTSGAVEQQRLIGNQVNRPFVNMWSRAWELSWIQGKNRKSKFYANFDVTRSFAWMPPASTQQRGRLPELLLGSANTTAAARRDSSRRSLRCRSIL